MKSYEVSAGFLKGFMEFCRVFLLCFPFESLAFAFQKPCKNTSNL